jgi:hypothetical protein
MMMFAIERSKAALLNSVPSLLTMRNATRVKNVQNSKEGKPSNRYKKIKRGALKPKESSR